MPRKTKEKFTPPGPSHVLKYSLGDEVMCTREGDGKLGYGSISQFHSSSNGEYEYFTFQCQMNGSYRLAKIENIIENPTKSQHKKRNNAIMALGASVTRRRTKKSKK